MHKLLSTIIGHEQDHATADQEQAGPRAAPDPCVIAPHATPSTPPTPTPRLFNRPERCRLINCLEGAPCVHPRLQPRGWHLCVGWHSRFASMLGTSSLSHGNRSTRLEIQAHPAYLRTCSRPDAQTQTWSLQPQPKHMKSADVGPPCPHTLSVHITVYENSTGSYVGFQPDLPHQGTLEPNLPAQNMRTHCQGPYCMQTLGSSPCPRRTCARPGPQRRCLRWEAAAKLPARTPRRPGAPAACPARGPPRQPSACARSRLLGKQVGRGQAR